MKVVAYLGEGFQLHDGSYCSKTTSAAFLLDTVGAENLHICSPSIDGFDTSSGYSSKIEFNHFYVFPTYFSTKDFFVKYIFHSSFRKEFRMMSEEVIRKHRGSIFWIRSPTAGSIIFGMQVLKFGEQLANHMCADVANTWRDRKYSLIEKIFGFVLSRYLLFKLKTISRHPNTTNFCTGQVLEDFCRKYSPHKTFQFVDLMVKSKVQPFTSKVSERTLHLLFVGRVVEDKGIYDLVRAVSRTTVQTRLTVVGDGSDLEQAKALASELGVEDQIDFRGPLPHHQLSEVYTKCDLVIVPSKNYYEGFPRVIMEAWAHGKPVIVTNVGGILSFVRDRENAIITAPGDINGLANAFSTLVDDENLFGHIKNGAIKMAVLSTQSHWVDDLRSKLEAMDLKD